MVKISKSPHRHTFQKEKYIERMLEKGEEANEDYLNMFEDIIKKDQGKFSDSQSHENNMEYDLLTTPWILEKVRASDVYAQNLYAAMCNRDFRKIDVIEILKESSWSCSWRYAGGIIADMREDGDYIDWYCSGIRDNYNGGWVSECTVTTEIRDDLERLGWLILPSEYDEQE